MGEVFTANMLVYRDSRTQVLADELRRELKRTFADLRATSSEEAMLEALLRAGELECALCDADSPQAEAAIALSDQLASLACHSQAAGIALPTCQQLLNTVRYDGELTVSRPEGFAYYALHPLDFADLISAADLRSSCAYVIGIRSIGTTLSAVVAATLNRDGARATRTTVRPEGHPYDRQTRFSAAQGDAIRQAVSRDAAFVVCDEGPGRSGSSLLSVAEALEREGVRRDRIMLLCSHQPQVGTLCAPGAAERWGHYDSIAAGVTKRLPQEAGQYVGGGEWRDFFVPHGEPWPAAWPQAERLKYLSRDKQRLFKFEGHGHYGEAVRQREETLASSGFGAPYLGQQAGFGMHQLVDGNQAGTVAPNAAFLRHVAKYCAWRAEEFRGSVAEEPLRQVEQMVAYNLEQEFGFAPELHLEVERPAICDGRMQHYEWRQVDDERWIKLDASAHGDDHFFPGPTDIAWDLAGVCVEWQLDADCQEYLLSEYRRVSGDNPARRLPQCGIAYTAFRLGWSRMAAASVRGTVEEDRLLLQAELYRAVLDRLLVVNTLFR